MVDAYSSITISLRLQSFYARALSTGAEASSDDLSRAATMLEAVFEATRRRWGADHERTTKAEALLADVREKALARAQ